MESIGEIIDQQSLGESLVVETSVDSPNQSNHGTVVMVGTVIDGIVTSHHSQQQQQQHHQNNHHSHHQQHHHLSSNNNNNSHHHHDQHQSSNHHHHHHHHHQQISNDDCISTESEMSAGVTLGPLSVSTSDGHSRIITHAGQSLELIKQEHKVAGMDVVVASAGELSPEEVEVHLEAAHHQHHHSGRHDALSVIVQPQEDSRDSQLLSPGKLTPSSEMIDTSDFRSLHEPTYQTLTSVNGRMSPPGFSPNSSYATLTPLQPLPPISTVSDKFAYGHASNVSGSFTVMQNNNMNSLSLGLSGVNSPFNYDKLPSIGMSPPHNYSSPTNTLGGMGMSQQPSPLSPQSSYSQNELQSPQKSMSPSGYESPYGHRDLLNRQQLQQHSPTLSPQSTSLNSPGGNTIVATSFGSTNLASINGLTTIATHSNMVSPIPHNTPPGLVQISHVHREAVVVQSPSPPTLTLHTPIQHHQVITGKTAFIISGSHQQRQQQNGGNVGNNPNGQQHNGQHRDGSLTTTQTLQQSIQTGNNNNNNNNNNNANNSSAPVTVTSISSDAEEINTKELAQRISAELKRYSIPQAIFAQRVLCRSQGTLSDLLRNPKPWSKLKSGRETFRRMYKWLQEPEFQRMSALRMADNQISAVRNVNLNFVSNNNNNNNLQNNNYYLNNFNNFINNNNNNNNNYSSNEGQKLASTPPPPSRSTTATTNVQSSAYQSASSCFSPFSSYHCSNSAERQKEDTQHSEHMPTPKKPRLVFTDLQRRTLQAIFKETKRPSKEMQVTIARQLGLEPTTVGNFFMNARRRSMDKWKDEDPKNSSQSALSPGNPHSLDLDDGDDIELDLGQDNDFDLDHDRDTDPDHDDML